MFVIFFILGGTYNAVQPRGDVALSIAVAGTVLGTGLIVRSSVTSCAHLRKVQGTVDATANF